MVGDSEQSLRARREAIVKAHVDAENRHDVGATLATFRSPRYDVIPFGVLSDGAEAVYELLSGLMTAFPDFRVDVLRLYHSDEAVICEVRMQGTQQAAWAGIEPARNRMDLQLACIFEFEGEDLVCERVYFDHATLLRQLRPDVY